MVPPEHHDIKIKTCEVHGPRKFFNSASARFYIHRNIERAVRLRVFTHTVHIVLVNISLADIISDILIPIKKFAGFTALKHAFLFGFFLFHFITLKQNPESFCNRDFENIVKTYLLENWLARRAALRPYFFLSFILGSRVRKPAFLRAGLYVSSA